MRAAGWLLLLLAAAAAGAGAAPAPQGEEEGCGALLGDVCAAVCAIGDECADEECRVNVDVGFVRSSKDLCECGGRLTSPRVRDGAPRARSAFCSLGRRLVAVPWIPS